MNILIAFGLSALLTVTSLAVAGTVLVAALATIYLRGYLVPGTPTLTRRYLPTRVQQWFGKPRPGGPPQHGGKPERGTRVSPEAVLDDAGVLTECVSRDDVCLTDDFEARWRDAIDELRGSELSRRSALAELLGISTHELTFGTVDGTETVFAEANGERVGQWLSTGALVADLGAARAFEDWYPEWSTLEMNDRGTVLSVLRVFLTQCPTCDGDVVMGETTTDDCCSSQDQFTVQCDSCETRLYMADSTAFGLATND
ncbi:hypothetical protein [Halorussus halophilus]|uniref:hypothetical protein n=1 Tax=Halorussus halophilus TaxID=2650975 RepID=UPI0013015020|nr:hypothetical protein [Halorussus halophilus]